MNDAAPVLLRRIDMRGASLSPSHLRAALPRGGTDVDAVLPRVRPVVEAVRDRGAEPHWISVPNSMVSVPAPSGFPRQSWTAPSPI